MKSLDWCKYEHWPLLFMQSVLEQMAVCKERKLTITKQFPPVCLLILVLLAGKRFDYRNVYVTYNLIGTRQIDVTQSHPRTQFHSRVTPIKFCSYTVRTFDARTQLVFYQLMYVPWDILRNRAFFWFSHIVSPTIINKEAIIFLSNTRS